MALGSVAPAENLFSTLLEHGFFSTNICFLALQTYMDFARQLTVYFGQSPSITEKVLCELVVHIAEWKQATSEHAMIS